MKRRSRWATLGASVTALLIVAAPSAIASADGPAATAQAPAGSVAPTVLTMTPQVFTGVQPYDATKCISGVVCQYLKSYGGSGRDLSSWTAKAWQVPADGRVCNPAAYFYYNTQEGGPDLWELATFSGCRTAPANGYIIWTTGNAAPVTFSGNTHVHVVFDPIWGATPDAYVHN